MLRYFALQHTLETRFELGRDLAYSFAVSGSPALQHVQNLGEQYFLRGRRCGGDESIRKTRKRENYQEIEPGRLNQEADDRIDEISNADAVGFDRGKVRLAANQANDRGNDVFAQRIDDARNAAPMMTPTARSMTLPREMKSLNPFNIPKGYTRKTTWKYAGLEVT